MYENINIIKERVTNNNMTRCILRTRTYCKFLSLMNYLYNQALKDFPDLQQDEVEVIQYAGDRQRYTYGIGFNIGNKSTPDEYNLIPEVELYF